MRDFRTKEEGRKEGVMQKLAAKPATKIKNTSTKNRVVKPGSEGDRTNSSTQK